MMHIPLAIGIDFGTSKSLAALYEGQAGVALVDLDAPRGDGAPWTPSVVSQWSEGGDPRAAKLEVGWNAWAPRTPQQVRHVKRWLGHPDKRFALCGEQYRPAEVAAILLLHVRANAESLLGRPIKEAVLSIPANFGGAARESLIAAARMAGINPLRLVNEPTAAALAYMTDHPETNENLLVFDFGGGTLDITILRKTGRAIHVHSTHGDPQLGGSDFDRMLRAVLRTKLRERHGEFEEVEDLDERLLEQAEKTKWRLSDRPSVNVSINNVGRKDGKNLDFNLTVTRQDLIEASRPLLERARACLLTALAQSGLPPEAIHRVLLVGGTVKIPAVKELVEEVLGDKCLTRDPITAVAEGSAILAAHHLGQINGHRGLAIRDVAGHGFGLRYKKLTDMDGPSWYGCLIAPNQELPYSVTRSEFSMPRPDQTALSIALYEGYAKQDCPLDSSFTLVKEETIHDIPVSGDGQPHRIDIEFRYNENAIIELKASVADTGKSLPLVYDPRVSGQDIEESAAKLQKLLGLTVEPAGEPREESKPPHEPPPPPPDEGPEESEVATGLTTNERLSELVSRLQGCMSGEKAKIYAVLRDKSKRVLEEAVKVGHGDSEAEKERVCVELEKLIKTLCS